jgi:transposase
MAITPSPGRLRNVRKLHTGHGLVRRPINEATLGGWVSKAKESGKVSEKPLSIDERAELAAAREEIRRLKMERDFLKKAAAWFASQNQ